jgi:hypothetical protein
VPTIYYMANENALNVLETCNDPLMYWEEPTADVVPIFYQLKIKCTITAWSNCIPIHVCELSYILETNDNGWFPMVR